MIRIAKYHNKKLVRREFLEGTMEEAIQYAIGQMQDLALMLELEDGRIALFYSLAGTRKADTTKSYYVLSHR